jgi:hypothetical protein
MAEFEVSYEISCWMKVRAKSAAEAEGIALWNPNAPFDGGKSGRREGILCSEAGEPHDFRIVEVRRRPRAKLNRIWRRVSSAAASAKAVSGRKLRTGGERHG